jgi:signal transduction histidine kinase
MIKNWNDVVNPVTKDWVTKIRQSEENFDKKARKNSRYLRKAYLKFHRFLFKHYFSNELCRKYPLLSHIRHEWANIVNIPVGYSISKFKKKGSNDILEQIIQQVRLTSQLFEAWEKFGNNSKQSLLDIFQKVIGFAQTTNTHKIIVLGEELLSKIESIQVGHKAANFIFFSTLLENAQKYSPEGSTITVEVSENCYPAAISDEGQLLERGYIKYYFSVSDEGIGIPLEDQELIFRKGQRGSNVGNITGTGFGLFLIYGLCNWEITITSPLYPKAEKYKGTKIKIKLYDW